MAGLLDLVMPTPRTISEMPPWADQFFSHLRKNGVVETASDLAGVSKKTAYKWRRLHPAFRARWALVMSLRYEHQLEQADAEQRRAYPASGQRS